MARKRPTQPDDVAACFEDSLAELESIVDDLESGKLGLSDALGRYEQGVKHLKACQQLLERAERRIELLSGVDADGNPITHPFDDRQSDSVEEKAAARSQRRSSAPRPAAENGGGQRDDMDDARRLF
jgi:exodeoxyribonuclease VII small subunit